MKLVAALQVQTLVRWQAVGQREPKLLAPACSLELNWLAQKLARGLLAWFGHHPHRHHKLLNPRSPKT
jgi:hypothetical protein